MTPLALDILLNWLWQGLVVAGAAAVALRVCPEAVPRSRLLVCWAALLLISALPLIAAVPPSLVGSGLGILDGDDQVRLPLAADGWASLHAPIVLGALWTLSWSRKSVRLSQSCPLQRLCHSRSHAFLSSRCP